ncbi:methyltransferase domain protein [Burkholderia pseudomallei 1106b]|nr:methyltransferase domain protein [Burkholderia pseudomallei 1106a]AFR16976.1 hypothetical protein BPC006_I3129 [Burkholderia pseudomallei BPC006]EES24664.1 methyltransferase domain protein [Burkholderia pseudomallei 1106b]
MPTFHRSRITMTQNIYDDPDFFEGYGQLPRSRDGLDGAPEWPSLRAMLPNVAGRRVVDLGCGYGWFCRWAAEQGAARVLGIDVSARMLDRAREMTTSPAVRYERADLERLSLPSASFELAYSSLAFHYVEHLPALFGAIGRALVPDGRLVFSIEHPIYMASRRPQWRIDENGHRFWPVDGYRIEGRRTTDWFAAGVVKYHRTLGTLLNQLIAAGFRIDHLDEWGPSDEQVAAQPALAQERERPMFALVGARR